MEMGNTASAAVASTKPTATSLASFTEQLGDSNERLRVLVSRAHEVATRALGPQPEEVGSDAPDPETSGIMSSLQHQIGQQQVLLNQLDVILDRLDSFC